MSGLVITTRDLFTIPGFSRRNGFCRDLSKAFFKRHGLDWRAFVRTGIDADLMAATGDGMALALVAWAHTRAELDGNTAAAAAAWMERKGAHDGWE